MDRAIAESLNIYQRLNKIREAVAYIQKDASVTGYKAITHDMVTSEVRPHLIKHGVIPEFHQITWELRDTGKTTKSGTPITVYIGTYEIHFVNIDEPKDRASVPIGAMAEDHGDKGPGKAASYATKTATLKILSIETGESDESRQEQKPAYISQDQVIEINDLIKEKKADKKRLLEFAKAKSVETILALNYEMVTTPLRKKE